LDLNVAGGRQRSRDGFGRSRSKRGGRGERGGPFGHLL